MTKYLVIAALLSLFLLLIYSRLYPYLQALKKAFGVAKTITNSHANTGYSTDNLRKGDQKLVRCVSCGTWVPAGRAIGTGARGSLYCSRECIQKGSNDKERKIAS